MTTLLIIVAVGAALVAIGWFVLGRHPETAASHTDVHDTTTSEQLYGGADRPAGPDVEPMDPDRLGGDQRPPS